MHWFPILTHAVEKKFLCSAKEWTRRVKIHNKNNRNKFENRNKTREKLVK